MSRRQSHARHSGRSVESQAAAGQPNRLNNFDYLRLFLALEVVGLHTFDISNPGFFRSPIPPVPAFLCLSGFLIPGSFSASRSWKHFAWKRILRVYPALLVSLVLVTVVFGVGNLPVTLLTYLTAGMLGMASGNRALWSLMIEEVCYAWHAVSQLRGFWNARLCALLLGTSFAASCAPHLPGRVFLGLFACFFAGNLIYFMRDKLSRIPLWIWLVALAGLMAGCAVYWEGPVYQLLSVPASFMAVMAALRLPQIRFRMPDLSYGTYVYHLPLLAALRSRGFQGFELLGVGVVATLAFSAASWYAIESQALKFKDWRPRR